MPSKYEKHELEIYDSPEAIAQCLNCPLPECKDCLKYGVGVVDKMKKWHDDHIARFIPVRKLIDLYNAGVPVNTIAMKLGIPPSSLRGRLKRAGIPFLADEPRIVLTLKHFQSLPTKMKNNYDWEGT